MTAYLVAFVEIDNPEAYRAYVREIQRIELHERDSFGSA
jgi:hypothetical protein